MLSADEFYEAVESQSGADTAAAAAESMLQADETTDSASDGCVTADDSQLSAQNDGDDVNSDASSRFYGNTADDGNVADNIGSAADDDIRNVADDPHVGDDAGNVVGDIVCEDNRSALAEHNTVLQADGSQHTPTDTQSLLSSHLATEEECLARNPSEQSTGNANQSVQLDMADSNMPVESADTMSQITETVDYEHPQPSDNHLATDQLDKASSVSDNSQETSCASLPVHVAEEPSTADSNDDPAEFVEASADEFAGNTQSQQLTVGPPADDTAQSQQLDVSADSNMPADITETLSDHKGVDSDSSQVSDSKSADDDNYAESLDKAASDNSQAIGFTSPLAHVMEEPSTADSNDDPSEFVEASTSLNPDPAGEPCASVESAADMETRTEQQQLEDGDEDTNNDEEQFVDSESDICPPQSAEGNVGV